MARTDMVIREEDHALFSSILEELREEANVKLAVLLHRSGQQIATSGNLEGADPTPLASLTAGNVAATDGLARLIGESGFSALFHEGLKVNIHISLVSPAVILLLIFDEASSLGLVRLRVQQRSPKLTAAVDQALNRDDDGSSDNAVPVGLPEISDEDIDALFG